MENSSAVYNAANESCRPSDRELHSPGSPPRTCAAAPSALLLVDGMSQDASARQSLRSVLKR